MCGSEVGQRGLQVGGLTMRLGDEAVPQYLSQSRLQNQGPLRVTIFAARSIASGLVAARELAFSARALAAAQATRAQQPLALQRNQACCSHQKICHLSRCIEAITDCLGTFSRLQLTADFSRNTRE
jgi:hypothetical protein